MLINFAGISFWMDDKMTYFAIAILAIIAVLCIVPIVRAHQNAIATGSEALAGKTVTVISWSGARGKVLHKGTIWDAATDTPAAFPKDTELEIVRLDEMRLIVRPRTQT